MFRTGDKVLCDCGSTCCPFYKSKAIGKVVELHNDGTVSVLWKFFINGDKQLWSHYQGDLILFRGNK